MSRKQLSKYRHTPPSLLIRNIVGNCYVGDSYRSVIRYVVSKMRNGYRTYRSMPKRSRHALLKQIINAHHDNRKLYSLVMIGAQY